MNETIRKALLAAKSVASSVGIRPGFADGGMLSEPEEARPLNNLGMYSAAAAAARALPQKSGTAQQMIASLKGVKPDEIKHSGVNDRWQPNDKITKEDLASHFEQNTPKITDKNLNPTRFRQYSTQGGANYREKLLQYEPPIRHDKGFSLTDPPNYQSSHWPGQPNVVAHLRMSDRYPVVRKKKEILPEPDTSLVYKPKVFGEIPEAIPAWKTATPGIVVHQTVGKNKKEYTISHEPSGLSISKGLDFQGANDYARRLGEIHHGWDTSSAEDLKSEFGPDTDKRKKSKEVGSEIEKEMDARNNPAMLGDKRALLLDELQSDWGQADRKNPGSKGSAPYIDSTQKWTDLGLKTALREAAAGGHTHLAWTPGEEQANRYNLSKRISHLEWVPVHSGTANDPRGRLTAWSRKSRTNRRWNAYNRVFDQVIKATDLADHVGKEVGERLLQQQPTTSGVHRLEGEDLSIGGRGMVGYYDNILPKRLLALAQEHDPDAKLSTLKGFDKKVAGFPALEITPRMRESIMKRGFKAFASGGSVPAASHNDIVERALAITRRGNG